MKSVVIAILTALLFSSLAWGQDNKLLSQLAAYSGQDREQRLLEGAKKEGRVVWYTTLAGASYGALAKAFEAKYPGISVEVYRADSYALVTRIMEEAGAGRDRVDVVETSPGTLLQPFEAGLLQPFTSPRLAHFPEEAKRKAPGGLVFWVSGRESYVGFAYNKTSISGSAVPKGFEDLLNPALRDKLGMTLDSTGAKMVGAMAKAKGERFVREVTQKLGDQHVRFYTMSGRALLDVLIAGEIDASPVIFRNHALEAMSKGAPIEWRPLDLVPTNAGSPALAGAREIPTLPCSSSILSCLLKVKKYLQNLSTATRPKITVSSAGTQRKILRSRNTRKSTMNGCGFSAASAGPDTKDSSML